MASTIGRHHTFSFQGAFGNYEREDTSKIKFHAHRRTLRCLQACTYVHRRQLQRSGPPASLAPSSNLPALMRALFSMTTRSS